MAYEGIGWENSPSKKTPLNAENLNTMDRVIVFDNGIIQKLITGTHEGGKSISGTAVVHYSDTQNLKQKLDSVDEAIDHTLKDDTTQIELKSGTKTNTLNAGGMSVVDSNVRANKLTASNSFKVENTYSGAKSTELTENGLVLQNRSDYTNTLATESGMEKHAFTMLPKEGGLLATAESVDDLAYGEAGGKNLIGTDLAIYPCKLRVGDKVIISKSKPQESVDVSLIQCDASGEMIDYWACGSNLPRTITIVKDSDYLKWNNIPQQPLMVERGTTATEYVPYIPSVKGLADKVNDDLKMLGWTTPPQMPIQNYTSNSVFHQRVGRVDMGSLNWTKYSVAQGTLYRTPLLSDMKVVGDNEIIKAYLNGYTAKSSNGRTEKSISNTTSGFDVIDSAYTDATAFKTAMSGKYLYYELATEQTKSVDGNEIALEPTFFCGVDTNEGYKQYNGCHIYVDASGYAYIQSGSVNIARFQAEKLV